MSSTADKLIDDYLKRLNRDLAGFPRARRRELVDEISEHIAEARADLETENEAAIRTLLDRLGDPEDIAAEARERFGARPKGSGWDVVALIMLLVGGVILPVIGWIIGVVLLWVSETWTTHEKLVGTLVVPGGLALPIFIELTATSSQLCSSYNGQPAVCEGGRSLAASILVISGMIVLFLAPIVTTAFLARRRSRDRARLERVVHGLALDESQDDAGVADRAGASIEEITVEDDEVGELAGLDRAGLLLEEVHVGRASRGSCNGGLQVEGFLRQHRLGVAVRMLHASDSDLDDLERIRSRDRPVASEGKSCPSPVKTAKRVVVRSPLLPDERERQIGHVAAGGGPVGLRIRHDSELGEAGLVVGMDELNVGQVVTGVAASVRLLRRFDRVERLAHGAVADRVEMHLEAVAVEEGHDAGELLGLVHADAAVVSTRIRLQKRSREVLEHAVLEDLRSADA
jgi:HAAS domain-containing protein